MSHSVSKKAPPEIWRSIFRYLLSGVKMPTDQAYVNGLRSVCRAWCELIGSVSTHWQTAWFRFEFQPFNSWPSGDEGDGEVIGEGERLGLEQLQTVLKKARGEPRRVGISTDTAPSERRLRRQVRPLLETAEYWEEIYVNINSASGTALWAMLCDSIPLATHLTTLSLTCNFLFSGDINPPGVVLRLPTVLEIHFRYFVPTNISAPNATHLALSDVTLAEASLQDLCMSMKSIRFIELHCIRVDEDWRLQLSACIDDIYSGGVGNGNVVVGTLCQGRIDLQFSGMESVEQGGESDAILDLLPFKYVMTAADVKSLILVLLDEPSTFTSAFLEDPDWLHMARSQGLESLQIRAKDPRRIERTYSENSKWLPTLLGGVFTARPQTLTKVDCRDVRLSWESLASVVWVLFRGAIDPQATLSFSKCRIVVDFEVATGVTWSIPIQTLKVGHIDNSLLLRLDTDNQLLLTEKSIGEVAPTELGKIANGKLVHRVIDLNVGGLKASREIKHAVKSFLQKVPPQCDVYPDKDEQEQGWRLEESTLPIRCYPLPFRSPSRHTNQGAWHKLSTLTNM